MHWRLICCHTSRIKALDTDFDFLRTELGLANNSVLVYAPHLHDLLLDMSAKHGSAAPGGLNAAMIRSVLLDRAQGRSSEWVRLLATARRSFFGFLYYRGETATNFSLSVPTVRKWRQATVPARLSPEEVEQALTVPDPSTALGGRDYAILLLLARLGLRAREILALELDDICWRAGEIIVHGKGRRVDHLPLPADVGEAMAHDVRSGRSNCASRRVFLQSNAPHVPLRGTAAIGHIVRNVLARSGIHRTARGAAHLFRHSLASRMIQPGASPHTVASYRDTFRLLLGFATKRLGRQPSELRTEELDVALLGAFFERLEHERRNSIRSRNNRLAAVHAFFRHVCIRDPSLALHCQRVPAIPPEALRARSRGVPHCRRSRSPSIGSGCYHLDWTSRQSLRHVAIQTGLRNAEISSLRLLLWTWNVKVTANLPSQLVSNLRMARYRATLVLGWILPP